MVKIRTPLNLLTTAVSLLGVAPLYHWIDTPARILFPLALLGGLLCDHRDRYPVGPRWATVLSFAFFGLYAVRFSLTNVVEPAVNILVLLLSVRLVTAKSGRNYLQIFALSLFALAGSSLLSLGLMFFPALVLMVTGVCLGLVLLSFYADDEALRLTGPQLRSLLLNALILPAVSLVLMVFFFIIMPRTRHPLWNFLNSTASAVSGFSEEVRPGAFASNAAVRETAFRAECPSLDSADLYWRGTVLNTGEGNNWVRIAPEGAPDAPRGGEHVQCVYWPEPRTDRFLFILDAPLTVEGFRTTRAPDLVHTASAALDQRISYSAASMSGAILEARSTVESSLYLSVDRVPSPRLAQVVEQIRSGEPDDRERIARVEAFFRRQQLQYATSDLPGSEAPVEEFLFTKKRGYCEFFASAFATVLRLSGVPARLVGGYHGGQFNDLGGYYLITEDLAHVWVEALIDGRFWVRFDPSGLAANSATAGIGGGQRLGTLRRLADAVDYFWNQAVVTYDLGRQFQLLRETGNTLREARTALSLQGLRKMPWKPAALAISVAALVFQLWRRQRFSPEERVLRGFLSVVKKRHGIETAPSTTLGELARQTADPRCEDFARIYGGALYRDRSLSPEEIRQLRNLIREIRMRLP